MIGLRILSPIKRRRQPALDREVGDLSSLAQEHRVCEHGECASAIPGHRQECGLELAGVAHIDSLKLHS
jgi:hypothetical protein